MNCADLVLVDVHNLLWMAATGTPASVSSRDGSRDLTGIFMFFAIAASWEQVLTWRNMARAIDTVELPARPTGEPARPESPGAAEVIEALDLW